MAILTVSGTAFDVTLDELPPDTGGSLRRAYDGNLRDSRRWARRRWRATTRPLSPAEHATYLALLSQAGLVTVSGDALGGASALCAVVLQGAPYLRRRQSFERVLEFELWED